MDMHRIRSIKKWHTIASFWIFCSMLIYGILKIDLSITNKTLSNFGIHEETNRIWIITIVFLSIAMLFGSMVNIVDWNIKYKKITSILFTISTIGLIGVAFANMKDFGSLHNIFACIFFILYPLSIFITGIQMIKSDLRIAMTSIVISILLILSFFWLLVSIQSLPEILFLLLIFLWNFITTYSNEYKNFLKGVGL